MTPGFGSYAGTFDFAVIGMPPGASSASGPANDGQQIIAGNIRSCGLLLTLAPIVDGDETFPATGCARTRGFFGQVRQNYNVAITAASGSPQHPATVTLNAK